VVRSASGPSAIETDADVAAAVAPMVETACSRPATAIVVACFSDPGLDELRDVSAVPVIGIAEAAVEEALTSGSRIGVMSSVADSVPRHSRYWRKLGVADHIAADIPLGLGVLELETPEAYARAATAGRQLVERGADVVVLGCTGMTHMQPRLEEELGVSVVDPCVAAVTKARRVLQGAGT